MQTPPIFRSALIALAAVLISSAWINNVCAGPVYVAVDPPDVNHLNGSGTWATAVNKSGQVAGQYTAAVQDHWTGFLRNMDGSYVEFAPPGAWDTEVAAITNSGEIAGTYSTAYNWTYEHGFLRAADGTLTTFDPPGSTGSTIVTGMNEKGAIVGWSYITSEIGFLRKPDGKFVTIIAPGAVQSRAYGINDSGQVAGFFLDNEQVGHGFIRHADGTFTIFDPPSQNSWLPFSCLDAADNVYGTYYDGVNDHGFMRKADGSIVVLDPPHSEAAAVFSTNPQGMAVGESSNWKAGFVYKPNGTFRNIGSPPDWSGINPKGISPGGNYIVGFYADPNGAWHGYLRLKRPSAQSPGKSD